MNIIESADALTTGALYEYTKKKWWGICGFLPVLFNHTFLVTQANRRVKVTDFTRMREDMEDLGVCMGLSRFVK